MNDGTQPKSDEPRNPPSSQAPHAAEPGGDAPATAPQPPGGYADPLRRERGSGLVETPEADTVDGEEREHLETTLGDHGGTG